MTSPKDTLLIVDDNPSDLSVTAAIFEEQGFRVRTAPNGQSALLLLKSQPVNVLITDLKMPGMDGLSLLRACRQIRPDLEAVILTAHSTPTTAFQAAKLGACHYIEKPYDIKELTSAVQEAIRRSAHGALRPSAQAPSNVEVGRRSPYENIIGSSPKMQKVFQLVARAANSKATVLIRGESGTGKELIARALHQNSPRKDRPFVAINCGAIPDTLLESELFGHEKGAFTGALIQKKGRFELADQGTLFLDEIGHLSPALQVKLLRVLQEREFERIGGTKTIKVDVRVIAATNVDLERAVANHTFREDLYYRLRVIEIWLPPLRERREDLPDLVHYLIQRYNAQNGKRITTLSADAWNLLYEHSWPGNVRELENAIERAIVLSDSHADTIDTDLLAPNLALRRTTLQAPHPAPLPAAAADWFFPSLEGNEGNGSSDDNECPDVTDSIFERAVNATERRLLLKALEQTNGNLTRAAAKLGLSLRSIRYYMKKHAISKQNWLPLLRQEQESKR
ncbi:MAG: sigma-54 dependent transcriptional regulator [Abditibacteriales bacterium]|nr:sigma-54 dependent transcriptional regulator [Abditibacteriales bacterium]MDW8364400.1 sigma-54 dependent transcriptional regulator [Abditibacteriales bacterium]